MWKPWMSFVTEIGCPIVVTFYLLHRIEEKLNDSIESIHLLPRENFSCGWGFSVFFSNVLAEGSY